MINLSGVVIIKVIGQHPNGRVPKKGRLVREEGHTLLRLKALWESMSKKQCQETGNEI